MNKTDILAFGAHSDDVEIGMGGTIAKYSNKGYRVTICDLTKAELSSNGTVDIRMVEANNASEILGVSERVNLGIPDRGIETTTAQIKKVVSVIRQYRPRIIFAPYYEDRHPDHGNCARLVKEASFSAGIRKFCCDQQLPAHKVDACYYYMINGFHTPSFVIDISAEINRKVEALQAYHSQFVKEPGKLATPLTDGYIEKLLARELLFGGEVGVSYGEGFISETPLLFQL